MEVTKSGVNSSCPAGADFRLSFVKSDNSVP